MEKGALAGPNNPYNCDPNALMDTLPDGAQRDLQHWSNVSQAFPSPNLCSTIALHMGKVWQGMGIYCGHCWGAGMWFGVVAGVGVLILSPVKRLCDDDPLRRRSRAYLD